MLKGIRLSCDQSLQQRDLGISESKSLNRLAFLGFFLVTHTEIAARQVSGEIIVGAIAVLAGVFVMGVGWYAMKANAQNE